MVGVTMLESAAFPALDRTLADVQGRVWRRTHRFSPQDAV
jgi:hypothetical protein